MRNKPILSTATGMSQKEEVTWVQQRLKDKGYDIKVDGIFGDETNRVVREFQKANNLRNDGLVGPNTYAKLNIQEKSFIRPKIESAPVKLLGRVSVIRQAEAPILKGSSEVTLKIEKEDENWANKILTASYDAIWLAISFVAKCDETYTKIKQTKIVTQNQTYDKYILNDWFDKEEKLRFRTAQYLSNGMKKSLKNNTALLTLLKDFNKLLSTPLRKIIKTITKEGEKYLKRIWNILTNILVHLSSEELRKKIVKFIAKMRSKLSKFLKKIPVMRIFTFIYDFAPIIKKILDGNYKEAFQDFCNLLYETIVAIVVGSVIVALFSLGLWAVALVLFIVMFVLDIMFGDEIEELIDNMASTLFNAIFVRN